MRPSTFACLAVLGSLLPSTLPAQIVVNGVTDETVYADSAAFTVVAAAGYDYSATLNGAPVAVGQSVPVTAADYYELLVTRKNQATNAEESQLVQFIIRSTARRNAEWGLSPWVPYPSIPSAADEFAGAQLQIVLPAAYPQGMPIPVVARVFAAGGERVGVNGPVTAGEHPGHAVELRRGVGSGALAAAASGGPLAYTARIQTLETAKSVAIDSATTWTNRSGAVNASTDWGEDGRIRITADLTVGAGATLTIGAGTIVQLASGVEIAIAGTLQVNGTLERPVVLAPQSAAAPWGGLRLRTAAARLSATGTILTGSGSDPDWFDNNEGSGSSHRGEEPLIYLSGGARADLTDCFLIDNHGQAGHGEASFLTMTRCLVQRVITTGQYNGGSVTLNGCALIEFPYDGAPFEDEDNDGLYLTGGSHFLTDTLIGWALDDGVDSGSGSGGPVAVSGCWFESCYHEGMAWSETRLPTVRDTVTTNNGQGIECGFGEPMVDAQRILSTGNLTGARFGDNYDWDYNGNLQVRDSLLLFNRRDIWGRAWDNWDEHISQMSLTNNHVSQAHPSFPQNTVWQPATHASLLVPYLPTPATRVGAGIATRVEELDMAEAAKGVPVRLSTFTTAPVSASYELDLDGAPAASGTLDFVAGETLKRIPVDGLDLESADILAVRLTGATNADLTGRTQLLYIRTVSVALIPTGSIWKYLDTGVNQGTAWRAPAFDDASWKSGRAELGFDEGDEETLIEGGPDDARFPTTYFRHTFQVDDPTLFRSLRINLRRDDGAVVYLNGEEVFRSNMPTGDIVYTTEADSSSTSETDFFVKDIGPEGLVAGSNVVAVEVHQASATSSDLSFELELLALQVPTAPGITFLRGDANGDRSLDISDAVKALLVLFAGSATDCQDAIDANDDGTMNLTDPVLVLNYLFRSGPPPAVPFPAAGEDATADALGCERS